MLKYEAMDAVLRAMSEPRRRAILSMVLAEELPAGEIHRRVGEISFGAVSQHLQVLSEAKLVSVRSAGRFRWYRAELGTLRALRDWLDAMWGDALDELRTLAEEEERQLSETARPKPASRRAKKRERKERR
jgi:DNA-binding transcriptional ArsR family regulator